jgi:hypothetical protein
MIGVTAAAKILFASRPKALVAWDKTIREDFLKENVKGSYSGFVRLMGDIVKELCKKYDFKPEQLLSELEERNLIVRKTVILFQNSLMNTIG